MSDDSDEYVKWFRLMTDKRSAIIKNINSEVEQLANQYPPIHLNVHHVGAGIDMTALTRDLINRYTFNSRKDCYSAVFGDGYALPVCQQLGEMCEEIPRGKEIFWRLVKAVVAGTYTTRAKKKRYENNVFPATYFRRTRTKFRSYLDKLIHSDAQELHVGVKYGSRDAVFDAIDKLVKAFKSSEDSQNPREMPRSMNDRSMRCESISSSPYSFPPLQSQGPQRMDIDSTHDQTAWPMTQHHMPSVISSHSSSTTSTFNPAFPRTPFPGSNPFTSCIEQSMEELQETVENLEIKIAQKDATISNLQEQNRQLAERLALEQGEKQRLQEGIHEMTAKSQENDRSLRQRIYQLEKDKRVIRKQFEEEQMQLQLAKQEIKSLSEELEKCAENNQIVREELDRVRGHSPNGGDSDFQFNTYTFSDANLMDDYNVFDEDEDQAIAENIFQDIDGFGTAPGW